MKAILKKATPTPDHSFNIHKDVGEAMLSSWHYHPEIELLLIKRSSGTCLIGDHVGPFKNGDTFLFGSNLPHTFRHERKYMQRTDERIGESVVVLFQQELWGNHLLSLPELKNITRLLEHAKLGLRIHGETRKKVARVIDDMLNEAPGKRIVHLLTVLELIASAQEYSTISSNGFNHEANNIDKSRINKIFEYTFNNFQNKITIEEVADLIAMGKHSFCRYFKSKTKKTYFDFLIEVRIGHACRLLAEQDLNVAEIGYACGYNNISHFYHQFKAVTNKHPLEYRANYIHIEHVA
ncbi:helix-turn-helix domain-containing protein [Mucilaginibacter sp. JRF]|uniref:AraC family transcriptional regulator n=1 Tax=Mucilaginibacter sp. JRF TaxID=2780088 RepID=UPI00187E7C5B|nr:AraC family transcriptional regulator [Mucilaginibacter sp. JRF]MBE9582860.1 helix-turn-helix domain-containing protein [Mucilaginibacter sp. JRF]